MQKHVAVIGAGPAGLTAGYLLTKQQIPVTVLEADAEYVGGIARTVTYQGYCFDIGGHRFFSKSPEIEALWAEILPNDMLERPRSSRIFYRGKFFSYPLKAWEALSRLGFMESTLCVFSYLKARLNPIKQTKSFSDWVINHFGKRLFNIFFKTYTEKVWGMRCEEISADWAAQRIKGLSLTSAIINALPLKRRLNKNKTQIKTLIDHFRYPRKGPGMMWQACAEKIKMQGGSVQLGCDVFRCEYLVDKRIWQIYFYDQQKQIQSIFATHLISSAPMRDLIVNYLSAEIPNHVLSAASRLKYRDFLIVVLILKDKNLFSDNWIYVHDSGVDVARIQNFKSWSSEMVPDETMCCYGMEYFCFKDDALWSAKDETLINKAIQEIVTLKLAVREDIVDAKVVRQTKAYPVYADHYEDHVKIISTYLKDSFPTLYLIGRNGMHKYNNQDHAMMTAMLTVKNILADEVIYDVWSVNQDAEYLESGAMVKRQDNGAAGLRDIPQQV